MILKLSKKKVFQRLLAIAIFIVIFLGCYVIFPSFNNKLITVVALGAVGILPNIILLIEYLINTLKIDSAEFTETHFKISFKNGNVYSYSYSELKAIDLYKAAGMDKGNYSFNSNEKYYFANIRTNDGKYVILTSLLGPDLSDALGLMKGVPVNRTKTGYAFIFLNID